MGLISESDFTNFVKSIEPNLNPDHAYQGIDPVYLENLRNYPNFKQAQGMVLAALYPDILRRNRGKDWATERARVGYLDMSRLVSEFPDPHDFEESLGELFLMISNANGPKKLQEYNKSLRVFETLIYGERFAYAQQISLLREEAKKSSLM